MGGAERGPGFCRASDDFFFSSRLHLLHLCRDDDSPDAKTKIDALSANALAGCGLNLFGEHAPLVEATEYKKGYVMRKCCYDSNNKKSECIRCRAAGGFVFHLCAYSCLGFMCLLFPNYVTQTRFILDFFYMCFLCCVLRARHYRTFCDTQDTTPPKQQAHQLHTRTFVGAVSDSTTLVTTLEPFYIILHKNTLHFRYVRSRWLFLCLCVADLAFTLSHICRSVILPVAISISSSIDCANNNTSPASPALCQS